MLFSLPARFDRHAQNIAITLSLAVPLLLILGRALAEIGMGIVSGLFLLAMLRQRNWQWAKKPWFLLAGITCAYMMLSGIFADFDRKNALVAAIGWLRFPLFTIAFVTWVLPHERTQKYLGSSLIILLALVAIDTLWQFSFGTSLSGHPLPEHPGRLTGPFHKLVVGVFSSRLAWPAIGFAFAYALVKPDKRRRLLLPLVFTALMGVTILVSGERMAFALFCLAGLFFFIGAKGTRRPLLAIGLVKLGLVALLILFVPSLHERIVIRTQMALSDLGASPYGAVWHNGWTAWKRSPVFGVGMDNFVPMCEHLGKSSGFVNQTPDTPGVECVRHPHNIYLEWLAETGAIGLALFISMIVLWIREAWRNLRSPHASISAYYVSLGYAVAFIPFLWPLTSSMSFFSNWSAMLFWWVLGIVLQPKQRTV